MQLSKNSKFKDYSLVYYDDCVKVFKRNTVTNVWFECWNVPHGWDLKNVDKTSCNEVYTLYRDYLIYTTLKKVI